MVSELTRDSISHTNQIAAIEVEEGAGWLVRCGLVLKGDCSYLLVVVLEPVWIKSCACQAHLCL